MLVSLSSIYLNSKDRLRAKHTNVPKLMTEIARLGQITAITLRPPREDEVIPQGKEWIVEAGARRFLAFVLLQSLFQSEEDLDLHHSLEPGMILGTVRDGDDALTALEVEFYENDSREDFDWKEKKSFVERIHDGHVVLDEEWDVEATARLLEMSPQSIYRYLEFRKHLSVWDDPKVQEAETFNTAKKQFDIVKNLKKREMLAKFKHEQDEKAHEAYLERKKEYLEEKKVNGKGESEEFEVPGEVLPSSSHSMVERLCAESDCRDWITSFEDSSIDFIHWDPPYGGEQGGGAHTSFNKIDDSWANAESLLTEMLPDLYRVLKDGHWMAIWCHPSFIQDVSRLISGHRLAEDLPLRCGLCDKPWNSNSLGHFCPGGEFSFWVNPYPNHWYKVDRLADGHDIKRFLINASEPFLYAAKVETCTDPILPNGNRQNVFVEKMVAKDTRRHVMHKPRSLLAKVIGTISLPGEVGLDPSYGSGSSIEAALITKRKLFGCELDHDSVLMAREAVEKVVEEQGIIV